MKMKTRSRNAAGKSLRGDRSFQGHEKDPPALAASTPLLAATVIPSIARFGPLDESSKKDMNSLLKLPKSLYLHIDGQSAFSASSDKTLAVNHVLHDLLNFQPLPKDIPDYGIAVGWVGGNQFCTVVDKSRKIIVVETIRSAFSEKGDWTSFLSNLKDALNEARKLGKGGKHYDFVISQDGLITSI
jgi:hypothetical protein